MSVIDLTHFLDAAGQLVPGPAGRVGGFYAAVAAAASTHSVGIPVQTPLRCTRRPGHIPCHGRLITLVRADGIVAWQCALCEDGGTISGWQGSAWDLRGPWPQVGREFLLTEEEYVAALHCARLAPAARAILYTALYRSGMDIRARGPGGEPTVRRRGGIRSGEAGGTRGDGRRSDEGGDPGGQIVLTLGAAAGKVLAAEVAAVVADERRRPVRRILAGLAERLMTGVAPGQGTPHALTPKRLETAGSDEGGAGAVPIGRDGAVAPDSGARSAPVMRVVGRTRAPTRGRAAGARGPGRLSRAGGAVGVGLRGPTGESSGRARAGSPTRPTWVEVDLAAIRHNVGAFKAVIGPDCLLMAVVKAGAYGHGAGPVARAALEAGAGCLGVAVLEEGLDLRRAGVAAPVLVLGWTPPERAADVVAAGLDQTVFDIEDASALAAAGRAAGRRVRLHAKVDTGMGRLGWPCRSPRDVGRATAAIATVAHMKGVELAGVYTHLATADGQDLAAARQQRSLFDGLLAALRGAGVHVPLAHCANTAGALRLPGARYGLCRVGLGLYGYLPSAHVPDPGLKRALAWYTRVAQVRELAAGEPVSYGGTYRTRGRERVATLPVGYADGFSRALSNRGAVWIDGRPAPVRGLVCMDQIVVGLDDCGPVAAGDVAVIIGGEHSADPLAEAMGTISYEVLCAISWRVPRVYLPR